MTDTRQDIEAVFRAGLSAVHGTSCVADYLEANPLHGRICVVAIGKAASAMATGALQVLGEQFHDGLLISRDGYIDQAHLQNPLFTCMEAGHPVPDARSLQAGNSLCRYLDEIPADAELLFLISGGASSLVEVLPASTGLVQLQDLNQWLIASGLNISAINRVRRSVSRIKGGGLLKTLGDRNATVLLISDVAGDDVSVIGSGLLCPGAVLDETELELPDWIMEMINTDVHVPEPNDRISAHVSHHVIARLEMATQAAGMAGGELGYAVRVMDERLAGDAATVGASLVAQLRGCPPGLYVWGGETTVTLPPVSGQGGRNQHLALAAARAMTDDDNIVLLSAGTDGSDGSTSATGAIVDAGTRKRCVNGGYDYNRCLEAADSGPCLEASGDVLVTGPTGTNVMDIVIGIKPGGGV